jgi:ABC-type uncharacterized transport system substrate-binding protein
MALTRRTFLAVMPLCASAVISCTTGTQRARSSYPYVELAVRESKQAPKATILVFMPETSQTKEVLSGLSDELASDFRLVAVRLESSEAKSVIEEGIRRHRPAALVLMNNPTVTAYRDYQRSTHKGHHPPAVVVMTSFLDGQTTSMQSWTGISYEVPLITAVTNLRRVIASPTERVGVVVRPSLKRFIERQVVLARREQITVVSEDVSAEPNASELKRAIRRLKARANVIWVLNDDRLLSPRLIAEGWLPELNERPWVPTIVGAASLVSPTQSFGTFAVLPDHLALGTQAGNMVFDIADENWQLVAQPVVQLPLSTTTAIDLNQAKERFTLREEALQRIDKILQ